MWVCVCVSSLTKSQWTQRVLVEFALSEYQIAHYIYPWHPVSGLSWTQQTLRQTDPIWKSTFWIWIASALASVKAEPSSKWTRGTCANPLGPPFCFLCLKKMVLMARSNFCLEQRRKGSPRFLREYWVSSSSNRQRCAVKVRCSTESHIGIWHSVHQGTRGEEMWGQSSLFFFSFGQKN